MVLDGNVEAGEVELSEDGAFGAGDGNFFGEAGIDAGEGRDVMFQEIVW